MSKRDIEIIIRRARANALSLLVKELKASMPEGWRVVMAVGWGFTAFNSDGVMITTRDDLPARLLKVIDGSGAVFEQTFGFGNEEVSSKQKELSCPRSANV